MLSFKQHITEASIRQGLPHLHSSPTPAGGQTPSLSTHEFEKTTQGGKVHIHHVTEKTDGQTFKFGYDEHGFYTQHSGSGSDRIRTGAGHIERAKRRASETGKEYDSTGPTAMSKFHDALHKNKSLQSHLAKHYEKHGEVAVSGEAFNRSLARPGDKKGEVKFVHTSYSTKGMGKQGSFIIHSKMPTNQQHDTEHFKKHLSDDNIKFDDDVIHHTPSHVDVKHEVADFHKLNHELINSRTVPKNKQAKLAEIEKFNEIKKRVSAKVSQHLGEKGIKNKWGSGTEGLVVHPSPSNSEATRFKAINPKFKEAKSSSTLSFGKK
jgi:hypothetical protein